MLSFTSIATLALPLLVSCAAATPITTLEARSRSGGLEAQQIYLAVASGCSGKNVAAGSVTLTATIPTTLADVAAGLSFFHPPNAAVLSVSSGAGSDNVAGASRTLVLNPSDLGLNTSIPSVELHERVKTVDDFQPFFLDRVWASEQPAVIRGGVIIQSHSSHFVLTPSCLKKASTLTLTTSFCSNDPDFAGALFQSLQEETIEGFQAMYGTFSSCSNLYI